MQAMVEAKSILLQQKDDQLQQQATELQMKEAHVCRQQVELQTLKESHKGIDILLRVYRIYSAVEAYINICTKCKSDYGFRGAQSPMGSLCKIFIL